MKDKFHKESGTILHYCELKIDKGTKKVTYTHHEYVVLVSNEKDFCISNKYGAFQLVEKAYSKYSRKSALNKVSVYEQKWNSKYFEDYLISSTISTFSEKVTKTRIKKELIKFIKKEAYFYNGLEYVIEQQLSAKETA